jgi:hypothetical protein
MAMSIISVITLAGCATHMTVSSHVERGLDLSRYRTFDWGPADALPAGDARLDKNPLFEDRVLGAVEKGLAAHGLALATAEAPDLLIHYHATIASRIHVNHAGTYGYCAQADCPRGIVEYEAATLVLDIVDARTNKLIWRGWAQNSADELLNDPGGMARTVEDAVARMLLRLPPNL